MFNSQIFGHCKQGELLPTRNTGDPLFSRQTRLYAYGLIRVTSSSEGAIVRQLDFFVFSLWIAVALAQPKTKKSPLPAAREGWRVLHINASMDKGYNYRTIAAYLLPLAILGRMAAVCSGKITRGDNREQGVHQLVRVKNFGLMTVSARQCEPLFILAIASSSTFTKSFVSPSATLLFNVLILFLSSSPLKKE